MRVKNFLKFLGIFVTIFVLQIATVDKVAASDINFGQKIFEKKNEIASDQKMISLFSQNDNENQISIAFTKKTQLIQKENLFLEEITTIV